MERMDESSASADDKAALQQACCSNMACLGRQQTGPHLLAGGG